MSPIALDPNETFPLSLASDAAKPEPERPAFRFRYLTSRAWRVNLKLLDDWEAYWKVPREEREVQAYEDLLARTYEALRKSLAGWEHLDRPFRPEDLDDVTNDAEARELLRTCTRMAELSVPEKNVSAPPSDSSTDAPPAPPAAANPTAKAPPRAGSATSPSSAPPAKAAAPAVPTAGAAAKSSSKAAPTST